MADITPKVRLNNSHSPNYLTLGHYGRPTYHAPAEKWDFLRESQNDEDDDAKARMTKSGLVLLDSQTVPASEPSGGLSLNQFDTPADASKPRRFSEKRHAVRFALNATAHGDCGLSKSTDFEDTNLACVAFGHAASLYEVGQHSSTLPIIVSTRANESVLNVIFYTSTEHEETAYSLPHLEQQSYALPAPHTGGVLGLCFSADKNLLAVRQLSGTSIVMLVHGQSKSHSLHSSVALEHVVTLPRTHTGGHEHADVAFHPRDRHQLGLVDTHGNWSIWQLHGRRSQSSRILYRIKLHASGKVIPSERNLKHFGNDLFFDGWHRICCLEHTPGVGALLVCSRRVARTFNFDGSARGDVDMRLGRSASRNWILDVKPSVHHPGVCFVLTSTHLQVMRLASVVKKTDDLDLLCSWPHYRDGSKLSLSLQVVDNLQATCLILFASGTDLLLHWMRWSDDALRACDPHFSTLPGLRSQQACHPAAIAIATVRSSDTNTIESRLSYQSLVQVVMSFHNGSFHNVVYAFDESLAFGADPLEAKDALVLAPSKDHRYKSSRMVEEDDMLDFVEPDESSLSIASQTRNVSNSQTYPGRRTPKTRDWSDIINNQSNTQTDTTIDDAINAIQRLPEPLPAEQTYVRILSEILPGLHVPDIEAASSSLAAFEQPRQDEGEVDGGMQQVWRSNNRNAKTLFDRYTEIFARYVEHFSTHVPERVKVQTERLCRTTVLDEHVSLIAENPWATPFAADLLPPIDNLHMASPPSSSPPASSTMPITQDEQAIEVLKRYTSVSGDATASLTSATTKEVFAHLPENLLDPNSYSYKAIEDRLKKSRIQQELDDMDERARRKAERAALKEEKRKQRQSNIRSAVTQQSTLVPGLVMSSPQRDPREVQSSQLAPIATSSSQPGLTMTQPERGTHGERRRVRKEGKHRVKGF